MGFGFLGGVLRRGEFGEGGREGVFVYGFLCIIDYWLGISLLVFLFSFSFSFFPGGEVCFLYFFSCFLPFFFSFSCPFLPLLFP